MKSKKSPPASKPARKPLGAPSRLAPAEESRRLGALYETLVLDTPPEAPYDDLTRVAASLCDTPMAILSLADREREWFKAQTGVDLSEVAREVSFCQYLVGTPDQLLEVEDATLDDRFLTNPYVVGRPHVRFYAGAPILSDEGLVLGSLSVLDRRTRHLTETQREGLRALSRAAGELLQSRRQGALLRESSSRLRAMFEQTSMGLVILNVEGVIRSVNERFCQIVDRKREALVGHPIQELVHPEDIARKFALIEELVRTGEAFTVDTRYLKADESIVWAHHHVSMVTNDAGLPLEFVAAVADVTPRKLMEAKVRESEERFIHLAQNAPLKLWTTDATGFCTFINKEWCDFVGEPMSTQLGIGWVKSIHPDDAGFAVESSVDARLVRAAYRSQYRLRRHDGVYRWHVDAATPRFDDRGEFMGYIGGVVDIHDQKQATDELQRQVKERTSALVDANQELIAARMLAESASRAKTAFLATMSHEIRDPMNAIIGMTTILLDGKLEQEQRDAAEIIRSSSEHLLTVVTDVLDYSKIDAGRVEREDSVFALLACIDGTIDLVRTQASAKKIEIGCLVGEHVPEMVFGDAGRLRQILLNLLSNAVKFTPRNGFIFVGVSGLSLSGSTNTLQFEVQDSGIGMDAETLARIFQPFVQADPSTARRFGGTGLGLSITRRLVELLGGEIRVKSQLGAGSTFTFTIKLGAVSSAQYDDISTIHPVLRGRRVLVVDESEVVRAVLSHYAQVWGMIALSVRSAQEALSLVTRGDSFDLALIGHGAGEMDGIQLAKSLRKLCGAVDMHIVLLSSVAPDAAGAGVVSGTLYKPIKPARMLEVVSELFRGARRIDTKPLTPIFALPRDLAAQHPLRLLVAEDNAANQKVAGLLLKRMGYTADFARSGLEALAALESRSYDAVLMDVQMPEMDGLTATRELCRRRPDHRPRIIGMTANVSEEDRRACEQAGMDDYIPKPVTAERLAAALRRCPASSNRAPV